MPNIIDRAKNLPAACHHFGTLNGKSASALDLYEASTLKKIVDVLAEISGETPDVDGSYRVRLFGSEKNGNATYSEQVAVAFKRAADGVAPQAQGFELTIASTQRNEEHSPDDKDKVTMQITATNNYHYALHGNNIAALPLRRMNFMAIIKDMPIMQSPDQAAADIIQRLASHSPKLMEEITKRTGLIAPEIVEPSWVSPPDTARQIEFAGNTLD